MDEFHCHINHGPHHGTYKCLAHYTWELWSYGHLIRWETFEYAAEYWKAHGGYHPEARRRQLLRR